MFVDVPGAEQADCDERVRGNDERDHAERVHHRESPLDLG